MSFHWIRQVGRRVLVGSTLAASLVLTACATNPVTGEKEFSLMSEAQEVQIGQEMDAEVRKQMGVYENRAIQEYVEGIGLKMARISERPNLPWHFTVVDVPAVNAFALPGGYIYITRGIMAYLDDEAELAGVIGHEIGHVTARHAAQAYTRATGAGLGLTIASIFVPAARPFSSLAETAFGVLFLKYGREDELQSDRLGARYAGETGWDPEGVQGMLSTLSRMDEMTSRGIPNFLATHPEPAARVKEIAPTIQELRAKYPSTKTDREDYLRRLDGMVFGDNPEEGVVRGDQFLHPAMRFALKFPEGWEVNNSPEQVLSKEPGADVFMLLQLLPAAQAQGRNLEEVAVNGMRQAGFTRVEGGSTKLNGLDAYVGTFEGSMEGLGRVVTRIAHIEHNRQIFILAGIASREVYDRYDRAFSDSIRSFRPLSREEADNIRPNLIDLYVVREGDSWQSIAQRVSRETVRANTLAIMNDSPPNQPPVPGRRIKVVVPG